MKLIRIIYNMLNNEGTNNTQQTNDMNQVTNNIQPPKITIFSIIRRFVLNVYYIFFTVLFIVFHGFSTDNNTFFYIGSTILVSILIIVIILSIKEGKRTTYNNTKKSILYNYNITPYIVIIALILYVISFIMKHLS